MDRHRLDLLSLLFGMLFVALGLVLLSGGADAVALEWAGPAVAISLGVMLVAAARPQRTPAGPETPADE